MSKTTRSQESTNAIERIYVSMRHLFNRGFYKPGGVSGIALRTGLLDLRPEIYGSIADNTKVELDGLTYVLERLPEGIEECKFINLSADEGLERSHFKPIIPPKRRRFCYRIDDDQMTILITRGRSEVYDILTHLTFLYNEADKIRQMAFPDGTYALRPWKKLEEAVLSSPKKLSKKQREVTLTYLSTLLGRTYSEVEKFYNAFSTEDKPERALHIIYWLGKLSYDDLKNNEKRQITFTSVLRERIGHHFHGEGWANDIKEVLFKQGWGKRPIHIISANMHSVMNVLYAKAALPKLWAEHTNDPFDFYLNLSENAHFQQKVTQWAEKHGMISLPDRSGSIIDVQIINTEKINEKLRKNAPILVVMDYAFGEQAYETMDELLKPFGMGENKHYFQVASVSIMGKAGILYGGKGDLMVPTSHVFEGTADNYPLENALKKSDFEQCGIDCYEGSMVTVLGTSLQNKDILEFFKSSTWQAVGLEMEGAHYQKAIQAASKIRKNIPPNVVVRYAYYASDNPLETGSTLASGSLGKIGVKPTYIITEKIIKQILE